MAFMRAYSAMSGDAVFSPMLPKRKSAGAGGRVKAFRKRSVRQRRLLRTAALAGDPMLPAFITGALRAIPAVAPKLASLGSKALAFLRGKGGAAVGGALTAGTIMDLVKPKNGQLGGLGDLGLLPGSDLDLALGEALTPKAGGSAARGRAAGLMPRRSMNMANVKALRRGLRRIEGFKKLVKRVDKAMPSGAKVSGSTASSRRHGKGCRCVACK